MAVCGSQVLIERIDIVWPQVTVNKNNKQRSLTRAELTMGYGYIVDLAHQILTRYACDS